MAPRAETGRVEHDVNTRQEVDDLRHEVGLGKRLAAGERHPALVGGQDVRLPGEELGKLGGPVALPDGPVSR